MSFVAEVHQNWYFLKCYNVCNLTVSQISSVIKKHLYEELFSEELL